MTFSWNIHKNIMVKILNDIYSDVTIAPLLGFKGGTAAALFYGLDRASVDLDFDLLDQSKEDFVFEKIKTILEKYGTIKDCHKKNFTLFFMLSYFGKEETSQNIKVEINRRSLQSQYEILTNLGVVMKVMARSEMAANKLIAMHERATRANRDIFDVYFFLHNTWPIDKDVVEKRMKMSYEDFLVSLISKLEKTSGSILGGLGELLNEKQKDWARAKLKNETLFLLRLELQMEKERKARQ